MLGPKLNYYWRVAATGFCFFLFGSGAVMAFALLLPLRFLPLPLEKKQRLSRRVVQRLFEEFVRIMQVSGVLKLSVSGAEKLQAHRGKLIVANHPTLIDVVVLISIIPDVVCIVKADLGRSVFLREVFRSTGYLTNSSPVELLQGCQEVLARKNSLLLFPEGTRSTPGEPLKLLRGAAHIALRCAQDFTPVVITCSPPALLKNQRWYQVPRSGPVRMHFEVGEDISVAPFLEQNKGISLTSRKLTKHLTGYFHQQLQRTAEPPREK